MQKPTVTKAQIKKERDPEKVAKVIKQKGYPSDELPRGRVLHHIKPVAVGGKTTAQNCQMLCKQDNRMKSGK
jgi:hypothetical protein